jgi:hypothetical protein
MLNINLNYYQGSNGNGFLTCPPAAFQIEVPNEQVAAQLLFAEELDLLVFPNPLTDNGTIRLTGLQEEEQLSVQVLALDGRMIRVVAERTMPGGPVLDLDLQADGLATGVYLVQVVQGSRNKVGRLVVE